ncbi:MAG: 50S ribosomal protein L17 [Patescibacteria group bacterium]
MRHQIKSKQLNRDSNSRKALFKGLVTSLITSGEIDTTETKAKVIKGLADKIIHKAQEGSVNTRRVLARFFGRRDVVNELVDKVAPAMKDRSSGFTRIIRLGKRRGDNTMLVKLQLVKNPHKEEVKAETVKETKKSVEPAKVEKKVVADKTKKAK